jgi:hypothetical protein
LAVPEAAAGLLDEDAGGLDELLLDGAELPHAASPMHAMDSSTPNRALLLLVRAIMS